MAVVKIFSSFFGFLTSTNVPKKLDVQNLVKRCVLKIYLCMCDA
jgi:hypothetical protein